MKAMCDEYEDVVDIVKLVILVSKHLPVWYFTATSMSFGPNADLEKKLLFMVTS